MVKKIKNSKNQCDIMTEWQMQISWLKITGIDGL